METQRVVRLSNVPTRIQVDDVRDMAEAGYGEFLHVARLYAARHKATSEVLVEFRHWNSAREAASCLHRNYRFSSSDSHPIEARLAREWRDEVTSDGEEDPRPVRPSCDRCRRIMRWTTHLPFLTWSCGQGYPDCPATDTNAGPFRWHCKPCRGDLCEACRRDWVRRTLKRVDDAAAYEERDDEEEAEEDNETSIGMIAKGYSRRLAFMRRHQRISLSALHEVYFGADEDEERPHINIYIFMLGCTPARRRGRG